MLKTNQQMVKFTKAEATLACEKYAIQQGTLNPGEQLKMIECTPMKDHEFFLESEVCHPNPTS
jgi:hypothetical protein